MPGNTSEDWQSSEDQLTEGQVVDMKILAFCSFVHPHLVQQTNKALQRYTGSKPHLLQRFRASHPDWDWDRKGYFRLHDVLHRDAALTSHQLQADIGNVLEKILSSSTDTLLKREPSIKKKPNPKLSEQGSQSLFSSLPKGSHVTFKPDEDRNTPSLESHTELNVDLPVLKQDTDRENSNDVDPHDGIDYEWLNQLASPNPEPDVGGNMLAPLPRDDSSEKQPIEAPPQDTKKYRVSLQESPSPRHQGWSKASSEVNNTTAASSGFRFKRSTLSGPSEFGLPSATPDRRETPDTHMGASPLERSPSQMRASQSGVAMGEWQDSSGFPVLSAEQSNLSSQFNQIAQMTLPKASMPRGAVVSPPMIPSGEGIMVPKVPVELRAVEEQSAQRYAPPPPPATSTMPARGDSRVMQSFLYDKCLVLDEDGLVEADEADLGQERPQKLKSPPPPPPAPPAPQTPLSVQPTPSTGSPSRTPLKSPLLGTASYPSVTNTPLLETNLSQTKGVPSFAKPLESTEAASRRLEQLYAQLLQRKRVSWHVVRRAEEANRTPKPSRRVVLPSSPENSPSQGETIAFSRPLVSLMSEKDDANDEVQFPDALSPPGGSYLVSLSTAKTETNDNEKDKEKNGSDKGSISEYTRSAGSPPASPPLDRSKPRSTRKKKMRRTGSTVASIASGATIKTKDTPESPRRDPTRLRVARQASFAKLGKDSKLRPATFEKTKAQAKARQTAEAQRPLLSPTRRVISVGRDVSSRSSSASTDTQGLLMEIDGLKRLVESEVKRSSALERRTHDQLRGIRNDHVTVLSSLQTHDTQSPSRRVHTTDTPHTQPHNNTVWDGRGVLPRRVLSPPAQPTPYLHVAPAADGSDPVFVSRSARGDVRDRDTRGHPGAPAGLATPIPSHTPSVGGQQIFASQVFTELSPQVLRYTEAAGMPTPLAPEVNGRDAGARAGVDRQQQLGVGVGVVDTQLHHHHHHHQHPPDDVHRPYETPSPFVNRAPPGSSLMSLLRHTPHTARQSSGSINPMLL